MIYLTIVKIMFTELVVLVGAGESGCSISLACEEYALNLPAIEEYIQHSIPVSKYNSEALLDDLPAPKRRHRPRPEILAAIQIRRVATMGHVITINVQAE